MSGAQIKPGYKRTEVGVIPDEWEVKAFGDCLLGRPRYGINAPAVPFSDRLPAYIRITDITEDGRFGAEKPVSVNSAFAGNYYLNDGDIVFARTGASVGKSYRYVSDDGPLVFAGFLIQARPHPEVLLSAYAAAYITTGTYWNWVRLMSMRSGQPGINGNEFAKLPVPIPSVAEQHAIATALSDVDALLAKLDQLIAKKRDLKQATMQQLLTGQTRLPGFSGEWEVKRLGSLGNTYGGLAGKTKDDFGRGQARYIPFMNVMTDTVIDPNWLEQVDVTLSEAQNTAKRGDLFFNGSSETPEEVGYCSVLLEDIPNLYLNSFCFGFRFSAESKENGLFFAYWFRCERGRKAMSVLAQGATRYNISKSAFLQLEISLPPVDEQTAIVTVLSDIDTELASLEARRNKTLALKQGMMQELLTGRIRLV